MNIKFLIAIVILTMGLANCSTSSSDTTSLSALQSPPAATSSYHTALLEGSTMTVWNTIQPLSTAKLIAMQNTTTDATTRAWVQLALIVKQKNNDTQQFANKLLMWRKQNPVHPANQLLPDNSVLTQLQVATPPQQIAVLLPQSGTYQSSGQAVRAGFLNAYYANVSKNNNQRIKFYDTAQSSNLPELYQRAIADGADFVIGPLVKEDLQQLSKQNTFIKPTLGLNYINNSPSTNFYEFGLLPEDEAAQLANRAHQSGLSHAIIIAPQNAWGQRLVSAFSSRWQALGGGIQETWFYTSPVNFNQEVASLLKVNPEADRNLMRENNDKTLLAKQRRQDFDVIFLFAQPAYARLIVPLLRYYYVDTIPIYASSSIYTGKPDPTKDADLNGVIMCDIPRIRGKATNRLYAVGQDAYLLSQSLQRLVNTPYFPLYGSTGALVLNPQHQIHRRIPCTPIQNGLV